MQKTGGPGAAGGSGDVDKDMTEGDLGDGTKTKKTSLFQKSQSFSWTEVSRWRARSDRSHAQQQEINRGKVFFFFFNNL